MCSLYPMGRANNHVNQLGKVPKQRMFHNLYIINKIVLVYLSAITKFLLDKKLGVLKSDIIKYFSASALHQIMPSKKDVPEIRVHWHHLARC
jgi:hypothetical protein